MAEFSTTSSNSYYIKEIREFEIKKSILDRLLYKSNKTIFPK